MADKPVIIDTSIWIDYFKGKNVALCDHLEGLIAQRGLRHLHIVTAELIRGALHPREKRIIGNTINHIPILLLPDAFWQDVGEFAYDLARRGLNIHLIDAWIAAATIRHRCKLWSLDKHFRQIAEKSPLEFYIIET